MWRRGLIFLLSVTAIAQSDQKKSNSFNLSTPQISAGTNSSGNFKNQRLVQESLGKLSPDDLARVQAQSAERNTRQLLEQSQADNVCYAIRSYIFRREDSRAPVLVKTTTCTHVLMGFRRVQHSPARARPHGDPAWATSYVPLNWNRGGSSSAGEGQAQ
jgi:hypothetical protein